MTDHALSAGPLDLLLDGPDVRYVRLGDVELVRRVYAAVRDPDWSTIPGEIEAFDVAVDGHAFRATMTVRHMSPDVDVRWDGTVEGTADGRVVLTFDALALADTMYNRLGFCLLHPVDGVAGRPFRAQTPAGEITGGFPALVGPQGFADGHYVPLFPSFSALEVETESGAVVAIRFEGDLFETEDQRNWTDASFKSYCTPLALGFPHRLEAGERVQQRITIEVVSEGGLVASSPVSSVRRAPTPGASERVLVAVDAQPSATMPPIGLGLSSGAASLGARGFAHGRADVRLDRPEFASEIDAAVALAASTDVALELALHVGELGALEAAAERLRDASLARVMVFAADAATATATESTPPALATAARAALGGLGVPLVAGTDMAFCELNRTRPDDVLDGLAFPIVAETHAFDDRSMVETLGVQAMTVRTAAEFAADGPVIVSPVTFLPRYNQHATRPTDHHVAGVDPRLHTPFAAAWTLGSVAALAGAGSGSLTYYEASGPRGVLGHAAGDVLARLAAWAGRAVVACRADDPLAVAALGVAGDDGLTVVLANLGPSDRTVVVEGIDEDITLAPYAIAYRVRTG